jgi:hypothetical protein
MGKFQENADSKPNSPLMHMPTTSVDRRPCLSAELPNKLPPIIIPTNNMDERRPCIVRGMHAQMGDLAGVGQIKITFSSGCHNKGHLSGDGMSECVMQTVATSIESEATPMPHRNRSQYWKRPMPACHHMSHWDHVDSKPW